jgi:hypothetical protein
MELNCTTTNGFRFKIIKNEDDPMTNRLSIGGSKEEGCYIVFRGNIEDCKQVLTEALEAFNKGYNAHKTQLN